MPIWNPLLEKYPEQPIFRKIVQALNDDIVDGRLAIGTRLPTHRELADTLKVARGTIAQAYAEADKLGLIQSHVGRGTVVIDPNSGERPFSTLMKSPNTFNDLTGNFPLTNIDPDPADSLRSIALRPDRKALLCYQSPSGMRRHRLAGVAWAKRFGIMTTLDNILLCAGAQHALFITVAHLLNSGDLLLVDEWSYPGLHGIAEMLRIKLVALEMDRGGLKPESLERACKTTHNAKALYCMPTIHNPSGIVISTARRKIIAKIARRHGLCIIEDAAHCLLDPNPPPPIFNFFPEGTFFIASTSKILGPGLRVAFLIAPSRDIEALARKIWSTQWSLSPINAELVALWIENGIADLTIKRKRQEAKQRQLLAQRILAEYDIQHHPHAFHLFLRLPSRCKADHIASEALKQHISVTSAAAFWMRTSTPPEAIRIALGGVDNRTALKRSLTILAGLL